jgi:hypothetical protein
MKKMKAYNIKNKTRNYHALLSSGKEIHQNSDFL